MLRPENDHFQRVNLPWSAGTRDRNRPHGGGGVPSHPPPYSTIEQIYHCNPSLWPMTPTKSRIDLANGTLCKWNRLFSAGMPPSSTAAFHATTPLMSPGQWRWAAAYIPLPLSRANNFKCGAWFIMLHELHRSEKIPKITAKNHQNWTISQFYTNYQFHRAEKFSNSLSFFLKAQFGANFI